MRTSVGTPILPIRRRLASQPAGDNCRCNRDVAEARLTGPLDPSLHFPGEMGLLWGMVMVSIEAGHDLGGSRSGFRGPAALVNSRYFRALACVQATVT